MSKKEIAFVHTYGILIGSIFSLFFLKALIRQYEFFSYFFLFPAIFGGGITGYIIGVVIIQRVKEKHLSKKEKISISNKGIT